MKYLHTHYRSLLLIVLLALGLFLRLYRISATQTFLEDEGRDMLIVKRMIDTHRPVLIGPQTSTGSMYLGPFYYYFITPALILAHMDPVGPAIFIAFTGVLTIYLIFRLVQTWMDERSAWIAATLYAIMPLAVTFTRNSWNPNLAPLLSLIIIWLVDKVKDREKADLKWFMWLGISIGLLVQLHYMALVGIGIVVLLIAYWWILPFSKKAWYRTIKAVSIAIIGLVISLSPFIIFELRNNWVNTHAITRFIEAKEERNIRYDLPLWLWEKKVVSTSTKTFGGLFARTEFVANDPYATYITVLVTLFIFFGVVTSQLEKKRKILLLSLVFGSLAILGIYQENIHMHYLGFLFTIVYVAYASAFYHKNISFRIFAIIITLALIVYSFPSTISKISSGATHQKEKALAVAEYITRTIDGGHYNIASSSHTNTTPYQYYTFIQSNPPINTAAEDLFLICEGEPCSEEEINNKQIFITGPAHPALGNYVGHPLATFVVENPEVISNEHVALGVWVAHIKLVKNN